MSAFSFAKGAKEDGSEDQLPFDEKKMESAMQMLASQADKINENDPKQATDLMRKLTNMTGMELGQGMQEALRRMEAGEDPEKVEEEMGAILEEENPFIFDGNKIKSAKLKKTAPIYDDNLYDL
jgi:hypothetical protein